GEQLESLAKLYTFYASENRVTINLERPSDAPIILTYDTDKVEKVVSNLIVNAIKYSGDPGLINLRLELVKNPPEFSADDRLTYAQISVSDNGCGMEEEDIPKIFQPFKRLLGIDNPKSPEGFGIGLHFVAHLVKEHKGIIRTVKNAEGGMTFTIVFPVCDEAFAPSEFKGRMTDIRQESSHVAVKVPEVKRAETLAEITADSGPAVSPDLSDLPDDDVECDDCDEVEESRPTLLVVDDNAGLNAFIASLFSDTYNVLQAYDGEEALQKALEESPDIIISDVLMPGEIDGLELCRRIKSDGSTSHIAVILLTAKTLDEHKVEGYKCGADDYICKPFNPDVLIARVHNLTQKRSRQASLILASAGVSEQTEDEAPAPEELSPLDKKFLDKLYAYIDNSLDNCDLNVNMLGRELGFSRTNFYRKVKVLTGISPNDLLRVYRLNRAAELLLTREYTVGEVGERTGFGN
ncbi:MAG: response regulator, partial [Duncaniella sp.]|nr:response regulator [Duncaniella sp.]